MNDYKELITALREEAEAVKAVEWDIPICTENHIREAADAIEQLVRERDGVVHGHWIVRTVWHGGIGDIYSKCSVCGFETRGEPHTRGDRRGSNYCEDCGAKMDE